MPHNPHPPLAVVLAVPFAPVAFPTAFLAYQVAQVLCLAVTWTIACRTFARGGWLAASLGGLVGLWSPVWQGLDWGQPVGFVALATVSLWLAARGDPRSGVAGGLLALACCLRPFQQWAQVIARGALFAAIALAARPARSPSSA